MNIRLDKFLVSAQAGSRSEVKELCRKGHVLLNDVVCKSSDVKIDPEKDQVTLDGVVITGNAGSVCYMLNKPIGYVCANTDADAQTVFELMPDVSAEKFFCIGRLDKDSEGMLLITNDGQLTHLLTSPRKHIDKTYEVLITGELSEADVRMFEAGMDIGEDTRCCKTTPVTMERYPAYELSELELSKLPKNTESRILASRVQLSIDEGRFHQVKRMFHAARHEVFYLKRVAIGGLKLDESLPLGAYRRLTKEEWELLELGK